MLTMDIDIITTHLELEIHGFSGTAINKDYVGTAFSLMDKMWKVVKTKDLKSRGLNIWIYEPNEKVFASVELVENSATDTGLEQKIEKERV